LLGVLSLMVGVLTFTVLFVDMAIQGVPRLNYDFFTSFPSRRAAAPAFSRPGSAPSWSCW
jgi:phosphate transport system permease protein